MSLLRHSVVSLALAWALPALADEGMWLYTDFPTKDTKDKYGFEPTPAWLDKVRLASVRIAGGCSASFVSPSGLVLTNHHCVDACIQQLSSAKDDFMARGFHARAERDEKVCPGMEANQLTQITDVTARVQKATQGLADQAMNDARKAEIARIEKACATSDAVRCDVVTLYNGGAYHLYQYARFQDVRLVFAPEANVASFGGDPDNFDFPRYSFDMSLLRVYSGGKPAATPDYLPWSAKGAAEGDMVLISGHPGSTRRLKTVTELAWIRDVELPRRRVRLAELRGLLHGYRQRGKEAARVSQELLDGVENSYKGLSGRHRTLLDKEFFGRKVETERAFRAKLEADPVKKQKYLGAYAAIDGAYARYAELLDAYETLEGHRGYGSEAFMTAVRLVRLADELALPNDKRLPEYTDAKLPGLKAGLLAKKPYYPDFEAEVFGWSLEKARETLGPDHPYIKKLLGKEAPRALAQRLVRGSKLGDVAVRKRLLEGGAAAIAASKDPMIQLVRALDADARAVRKRFEDEVEAPVKKASEQLAQARLEVLGTSGYPDATFSLRLSYGPVMGFKKRGQPVPAFTTVAGLYERATGAEPFDLPQSWLRAQSKLDPSTPFCMVSRLDTIGGNSGSPVVDKSGALVGLNFDSSPAQLGGDYGYEPIDGRNIAVHSSIILEALDKVYDARRLVKELRP
jgi:hypothetical protein